MIRPLFAAFACLMATSVAADTTPAPAEVAIIHYDKLSEAKLNGNAKNLTLSPVLGTAQETPCLQLVNMTLAARKVTVRILGLNADEYELYLDTDTEGVRKKTSVFAVFGDPPPTPNYRDYYVGVKTRSELEAGIVVGIPGTKRTLAEWESFKRIRENCAKLAPKYANPVRTDGMVCQAALKGVPGWIEEAEYDDLDNRTARIVVAQKGSLISTPSGSFIISSVVDPSEKQATIGDTIQSARANLIKYVPDPISRNEVVQALTPVDFTLSVEKSKSVPGRYVVRAALRNWTDRLITGKVNLIPPSGWSVKPVLPTVRMGAYGRSVPALFTLVATPQAAADTMLGASAVLSVDGVDMNLLAKVDLAGAK